MSKQRMIRDSFWTDSYVEKLSPDEKLIFIYLLTNPLANVAGVYEIRNKRIGFETGYDVEVIENILSRFERDKKILRHNDWIVLVNHIKNQALNPSIIQGCQRIFNELPDEMHRVVTGWVQAGLLNLTLLNLTYLGETSSPELEDKSKDMGWNNKSDDFEEGYVDLDGDGSLLDEKKKPTRKYPNAPAVRKLFQEILGKNPANWKINKNQLQACENLSTGKGMEKTRRALEFYKDHEGDEFCPVIHSPYDLDSKWDKLLAFKKKQ